MEEDQAVHSKLAGIERLILELRGVRHAITDDLQWAEKEADRLRCHIANYGKAISQEEDFTLETREGPDGRCPVCGELPVEIEGP